MGKCTVCTQTVLTARLNDRCGVTGGFSVTHPLDVALLLLLQELQQFCAGSVVPDQIGVLRITVEQLQHLSQPGEASIRDNGH